MSGKGAYLTLNDLHHLGANLSHFARLRVAGLAHLLLVALGEANAEQPEEVTIRGLHRNAGLDECLKKRLVSAVCLLIRWLLCKASDHCMTKSRVLLAYPIFESGKHLRATS